MEFGRGIIAGLVFGSLILSRLAGAAESELRFAPLSPELTAVPQTLLNLVHAKEVQAEFELSREQMARLEGSLREIDAKWWPARIAPAAEQRKIVAALEQRFVQQLQSLAGPAAVARLRQIELQSEGARILLRPEVAAHLGLDAEQSQKLSALFAATDQLLAEAGTAKAAPDSEKAIAASAAQKGEAAKAIAVIKPDQFEKLRIALGKPFETSKLERIYPLAPEFIDSGNWTSAEHPTLKSLRGQVVLVHFYAFQCHNCVANFGHYKRWDESLRKKGVRLIGIQTPETSAERDAAKVKAAASKEGFQFPVLIDLENKNWDAWGNTMWPTVYVVDKNGYIRFWWQGELNWQGATVDQRIEKIVEQLVAE